MAKFLETTGVSHHLMQLIRNTKQSLTLISPYLKLNDRIKSSLKDLDIHKKNIFIVYGKKEITLEQMKWIKDIKSIRSMFVKNLHAKCYMNEDKAIITSMNLYQFSQENNNEMGILVDRHEDKDLFNEIDRERERLIAMAIEDDLEVTITKKSKRSTSKPKSNTSMLKNKTENTSSGHCIRCSSKIKLNPMVPYCNKCFSSWKKYENDEYKEKVCHVCGKDHPAILIKPNCYPCFKKYKNELKFPGV